MEKQPFHTLPDSIAKTNVSEERQANAEWQPIETAPKNATEVRVKMRDGTIYEAHWASDLSGSDQPPFQGWFVSRGTYFAQIDEPVAWMPKEAQHG